MKESKLINVKLTKLIGKNVSGLSAQVTNPMHLKAGAEQRWRTLKRVKTYLEKGVEWVELFWDKQKGDSCDFTGCTVRSNVCTIQFTREEYAKII